MFIIFRNNSYEYLNITTKNDIINFGNNKIICKNKIWTFFNYLVNPFANLNSKDGKRLNCVFFYPYSFNIRRIKDRFYKKELGNGSYKIEYEDFVNDFPPYLSDYNMVISKCL